VFQVCLASSLGELARARGGVGNLSVGLTVATHANVQEKTRLEIRGKNEGGRSEACGTSRASSDCLFDARISGPAKLDELGER